MMMSIELKTKIVNGEVLISAESLNLRIMELVEEAVSKKVAPLVAKAADCNLSISELVRGLGGSIDSFDAVKAQAIEKFRLFRFASQSELKPVTDGVNDILALVEAPNFDRGLKKITDLSEAIKTLVKASECGLFDKVIELILSQNN
jgi:hypothetical protein